MTIIESLQKIGLTEREATVYLYLLKNGPSSPTETAQGTGILRPNVYDIARSLTRKGLLNYQLRQSRKLLAAEPAEKIEELAKQQLALAKFTVPFLNALAGNESFRSKITFYEGSASMQNLLDLGLSCKAKEIWYIWPPKDMDKIIGKKAIERHIAQRLKKGIKIRSLRPVEKESLYKHEGDTALGRQLTEVAYVPENRTFSLGMAIYDDKTAFFASKKESFGFLVESREFSQVMRMLYETLWNNSGKLKQG